MSVIDETEMGNNWTVVVFDCLCDKWPGILMDLFGLVEGIEGTDIPHFSIREARANPRQITVSFRILRSQSKE